MNIDLLFLKVSQITVSNRKRSTFGWCITWAFDGASSLFQLIGHSLSSSACKYFFALLGFATTSLSWWVDEDVYLCQDPFLVGSSPLRNTHCMALLQFIWHTEFADRLILFGSLPALWTLLGMFSSFALRRFASPKLEIKREGGLVGWRIAEWHTCWGPL